MFVRIRDRLISAELEEVVNRSLILHGYRPLDLRYHQSNADGDNNGDSTGNAGEKITFNSQADLDRMVQRRLERDREAQKKDLRDEVKAELEGERSAEEALEAGKYKDLYDAEVVKSGKLQDKIDELKGQIAATEHDELRRQVAAKHSIPDTLVDRLKGDNEEELTADAKALAKSLNLKAKGEGDGEESPVVKPVRRPNTDAGKGLRPQPPGEKAGDGNNGSSDRRYVFAKEGDVSWG